MAKINLLTLSLLGILQISTAAAQDFAQKAHEASARGDMTTAIDAMQAHLKDNPNDIEAKKDLAHYYIWTGAYADAEQLLAPLSGSDDGVQALRANNFAWAGWLDAAQQLNAPGLSRQPDSFFANYTQAIALRQTAQAYRAWPYVETAAKINPDSKDAIDLRRGTFVPTASSVSLPWSVTEDSTDIRTEHLGVNADIVLSDNWRLLAEWARNDYQAPLLSPFASINGERSIDEQRIWLGISSTPIKDGKWTLMLGQSRVEDHNDSTALLRWEQRVNDDWRIALSAQRDRLGISPRAVSLGLMRGQYALQARFTPSLRWTFDGDLSYQDISDGNDRLNLQLAARRAVIRHERVQLDLGAETQWLSYDHDPQNGYYAPDSYKRVSLIANAYFPFGDDMGLAVSAGVGQQRDEQFRNWKGANDISAEWVCGIFSKWELRLRAGYSDRAQPTGLYDASTYGFQIKRRF